MQTNLAIFGCIVFVFATIQYFRQLIKGDSVPNPATWLISSTVMIINAITYFIVVKEHNVEAAIAVISAICLTSIFLFSLFKGKFAKLVWFDYLVIGFIVAICAFWYLTGDAISSNLLIQIVLISSFLPTIVGLLTHKLKESPIAWSFALIPYVTQIFVLVLSGKEVMWQAYVFPIVNGILGNGLIAVISLIQKFKK